MNVKTVKISEVKQNPNNPRTIRDDKFTKLVASIKAFPEMLNIRPIVVNTDMVVLGGNMRLKACREAGLKQVPIIVAGELTEAQQREFIIKDNVSGGDWDWSALTSEWDTEQLEEWGLDIPEFETDKTLEAVEDDYQMPDEIQTDIVLGDLFEIGEHRLLCGDSTDSDAVARLMDGEKADMVFTDPPYNVDYVGKTKEKLKIQNDKHNVSEFRKIISDALSNLILFTKRGGAYYVCIPLEVGVTDLFLERTHLQSVLIWLKNTIVMGRKDYQQQTEPILFLLNDIEEETYEGIVYGWNFGDSHTYYGGRKQSNVWKFDKPQRNGEHPTMKPIPLVGKAINNSSKEKDLTLDLFLGSGSTMVAAHQLKRKCYGMELDPKYCQVIVDRMLKLDPSLKVKRNGQAYIKTGLKQGEYADTAEA
jgi:site-specific DNA-methyltransferase (adenine-specific)